MTSIGAISSPARRRLPPRRRSARSRPRARPMWRSSARARPGIAAARKVAAAGRRFALIEASDHVGGRCVTDTRIFGVPFDRGAHWLHMPDINPVAKLAPRAPGSISIRRRPGRSCASASATRAKARWRIISPPSCARTAPSRTPRAARPTCPACRRCRRISATGGRRSNSCSARSAAARISTRSRRWISRARSSATSMRSAARVSARCWRSSRADLPVQLDVAGHAHAVDAQRRRDRDGARAHQRARRDRHGVDRRARRRQDQVHARAAEAPARRHREALARQPTTTSRWS